jgi:hypothetical protein
LNQITPEFHTTIDNYSIKFHKPNDIINEPEYMGDSHNQIILPFNLRLDYNEDGYILHQTGEEIDDETFEPNNQILIEYGVQVPSNLKTRVKDLTELEDRIKTLEGGGNSDYIIDEIKAINPNVRIDECVYLFDSHEPHSITYEMNEKFFPYCRRLNTDENLQAFGVFIQIYGNTHKGALFFIDKFHNFITLGNKVFNNSTETLQFETTTLVELVEGNVEVNNVSGIRLSNIKDDTSPSLVNHKDGGYNKIVILYGIDLTYLGYGFSSLENGSGSGKGVNPDYIIEKITATNSYVGIDQCYNLFGSHEPFCIPYKMNNKFFQYFTKLDVYDNMEAFGVLVQIYDKDFTENLLKINKQDKRIELGSDRNTSEGNKILYETETILQGYVKVSNYTGFKKINKTENSYTIIIFHEKVISFMDYFGQHNLYQDIVISRGLRYNHQTDI